MNIRDIKYFLTAAECLNFTEASKKLFITQPTLSYSIAKLEKELNAPLFIRTTKSVALSEAGAVFLRAAAEIVSSYDGAVHSIDTLNQSSGSSLTVGFLGSAFYQDFPKWIPSFKAAYPDIAVRYQVMNAPQMFRAVENNELDVGFCRKIEVEKMSGIHYEPFLSDQILVVVSQNHPLAAKQTVDLGELREIPFIIVDRDISPNYYNKILSLCSVKGFAPQFVQTVGSTTDIYPMVQSGLGAAFLPSSCNYYNYPSLCRVNITGVEKELLELEAGAIWKKENKNPNIRKFLKIIRGIPR